MTESEFTACMSEIPIFDQHRKMAAQRLDLARDWIHSVAGQDRAVEVEAGVEVENALAEASEWGLIQMGPGP